MHEYRVKDMIMILMHCMCICPGINVKGQALKDKSAQ